FAESTTCRYLEAVVRATCDLAAADREAFWLSGYAPPKERPAAIRLKARSSRRSAAVPGLTGPMAVVIGQTMSWLPTLTDRRGEERTLSLRVRVSEEVLSVLEAAEAAARAHGAEDCSAALRFFLAGFLATWKKADRQMRSRTRRIMESCDYRCQVPGCTRRAFLHQHHLEFRSHGGGDEDANLAGVCDVHHQGHLHGGTMKARREQSGSILWQVGIRNGQAYQVFRDDVRLGRRRSGFTGPR
ncbi:HNH endonuclease, partial [bacterium CPR1]|nr:HNH endonuclease [bacterium CPR1]